MSIPFIPAPHEEERLRVGQYDYRQWRIEKEQADPSPPIRNVQFTHNPNWRNDDFFSLQAIRDSNHSSTPVWLFWQGIRWLFVYSLVTMGSITLAVNGEIRIFGILFVLGWICFNVYRSEAVTHWRFIWAGRRARK